MAKMLFPIWKQAALCKVNQINRLTPSCRKGLFPDED